MRLWPCWTAAMWRQHRCSAPARFFSIAFTQTTASKIGHFYSFPHPSPPAISFLILHYQWKRTINVGFFSFLLKSFPWLRHTPPPKMPTVRESPEAPLRETSQKAKTLPLVAGVVSRRCTSLPGGWYAIVGCRQSKGDWFASSVLTI